jgi:hypothetical protein
MKVVQMKPVPIFSHVWLHQKSSKMTVDSGCMKISSLWSCSGSSSNPEGSLQRGSITWCFIQLQATMPLETILNSLYFFTQNDMQMAFF